MGDVADDLVAAGELLPSERTAVVTAIEDAARQDRFEMRLTMHALLAIAPEL
jgi:hypothetical protein